MKIQFTIFLFLVFSPLYCMVAHAKDKVYLIIKIIDVKNEIKIEKGRLLDSLLVEKTVSGRLNEMYYDGYLAAHILDQKIERDTVACTIFRGERYNLKYLSPGNVDEEILNRLDFKKYLKKGRYFQIKTIEKFFLALLEYSENNGYPFATVKLDSIQIEVHNISANVNWKKGPLIVYDSIEIVGYHNLKRDWINEYLNIVPGEVYKQKTIDAIPDKIRSLTFLGLVDEPRVNFYSNKSKITIEVRDRKVNNIDGLLGIFPNSREGQKILITGSLKLHLYNLFASAKQLHFDWQKVNVSSQTLNAGFYFPRFLKMPLGVKAEFSLLKEDTLYLNRTTLLSLDFKPGKNQLFNFITEFENSDLLTSDENYAMTNNLNNYKLSYYGLTYQYRALDDSWFPKRGWRFLIEGYVGQKKFEVLSEPQAGVNQNETMRSTQYKIRSTLEDYLSLSNSYVIKLKLSGGTLLGNNIFTNDLYRLGGLNSLRGFNENFFFASDFAMANVEFRLINSEDTYFFLFYDQGLINNKANNLGVDYPFGTGLGIRLGTSSGIFSFVVALGKSGTQIFSLNSAKIHFGYTGRF